MRLNLVGLNQNQLITDSNLLLNSLSGGIPITIIKKTLILQNQILVEMKKAQKILQMSTFWILWSSDKKRPLPPVYNLQRASEDRTKTFKNVVTILPLPFLRNWIFISIIYVNFTNIYLNREWIHYIETDFPHNFKLFLWWFKYVPWLELIKTLVLELLEWEHDLRNNLGKLVWKTWKMVEYV